MPEIQFIIDCLTFQTNDIGCLTVYQQGGGLLDEALTSTASSAGLSLGLRSRLDDELVTNGKGGKGQVRSKNANQLTRDIKQGKGPKSFDRVDPETKNSSGQIQEQTHVHLKDGRALNKDGTWKHNPNGDQNLTKKEKEWLKKNGWNVK